MDRFALYDLKGWKHIENTWPDFVVDSRNIRLV